MQNLNVSFLSLFLLVACGGGGGPAGAPGGAVAVTDGGSHPSAGLISTVPAQQELLVQWRAINLPNPAPELAVFVGTDESNLLAQPPISVGSSAGKQVISGLNPGVEYFAVLGIQQGGQWVASGPVLRGKTRAPIYVNPGASGGGEDGQSPSSAFATLTAGVTQAVNNGGGNLWIASGNYPNEQLILPAGVRLYGGFAGGMTLAERNPDQSPSLLGAANSLPVVFLAQADGDVAVLDGLQVDGEGQSEACIEVDQRFAELRQVSAAAGVRGFKLRSINQFDPIGVTMVRCLAANCVVGGVSIDGSFDLLAEDCTFRNNLQEGMTADDLLGLGNDITRLELRDCVFQNNGSEGLDVDLGVTTQSATGRWVVILQDCEFLGNALDGCLIDCDYELFPGWNARMDVRGCVARGNGGAGIHLDLDAASTAVLNRVLSTGNRGDGLLVTSESAPGMATVNASEFSGNLGYGVHSSLGNVGVVLSHSILTGNQSGGFHASLAPGSAVSTIAFLQPNPFNGVRQTRCLTSTGAPNDLFLAGPSAWFRVNSWNGANLGMAGGSTPQPLDVVEVGGDGVARTVVAAIGTTLTLDPAPSFVSVPTTLAVYPSASVAKNWRPSPGSPLLGAGMGPVGGPDPDQGPFGAPAGGEPGSEPLIPNPLFRIGGSDPSWTLPIAANAQVVLSFEGGAPNAGSASAGIEALDASGNPLPISISAPGNVLILTPPGAGWPSGSVLRVHSSMRSLGGEDLGAPVLLPLTIP